MSATTSALGPDVTGDRAPSQGGVIEGANPSEYNPRDPLTTFIIQAGLILIVCHALHWPLTKIRQPRVIAEVIGGIILGPSVMGRIPGFSEAIFPRVSIPNLTLVANLGLVLYLFLIGLETDIRFLVSNWRTASAVAFGGLALPFGLGCALAWGLYHEFRDDEGLIPIQFTTYMLFVGVAIAITAFPVLCRILTELRLLSTNVGIITLSAGVANDVIGWILLALCVALANAGSGVTAVWILLACVGYLLVLVFAVRPALHWFLRRTGSIDNGPSQSIIALIVLLALTSAFYTGIIGVHAIFGGFMVGLILPRENGFAIKVTEKLEDLIGALFLPLYFTLSGLNTNLGLLDSGIVWAYVFAVTFTAFFSKIIGATISARLTGLVWRESLTVGALMSCKGLVELIVLNIGLQARILSTRTFTVFVVMALLTTFTTTPLASFLYPPWYQKKIGAWKRGEIDWETGKPTAAHGASVEALGITKGGNERVRSLLLYLRLDNLPSTLSLVSLFGKTMPVTAQTSNGKDEASSSQPPDAQRAVRAHGLRLIQLGDRDSSVMTVSEVESYSRNDTVVNIFRTVGQFLRVAVSGEVAVLPETRFAEALLAKSRDMSSDLVLVPWSPTGSISESQAGAGDSKSPYIAFAKSLLSSKDHNVAVFYPNASKILPAGAEENPDRNKLMRVYSFSDIHRDVAPIPVLNKSHHIFMPFLGSRDDRYALNLVLQMCEKQGATATIVSFTTSESPATDSDWFGYKSTHLPEAVADRVDFQTKEVDDVTQAVLETAVATIKTDSGDNSWDNVIVVGRGNWGKSLSGLKGSEDLQECLGPVAATLISSSTKADVLIVQAKLGLEDHV
ncbi:K+/H+ antiporter 1 [Stachybotrys elegans]|uniref:K+/H+ antiporter 1 n=1 Tax=Stachybotrys elegans TaxID=80388 RepID=A0A8K0T5B0_9HYPO|nr:K+/H+ antiporter 1 [Stachybotrys elegans]